MRRKRAHKFAISARNFRKKELTNRGQIRYNTIRMFGQHTIFDSLRLRKRLLSIFLQEV